MAIQILPLLTPVAIASYNMRAIKSDGCWSWSGTKDSWGYGRLSVSKNTKVGAHRFSYGLHFGVDPENLCVLHRCDNPECTNPDHLFLGTHMDNTIDKMQKGRAKGSSGELNPRAKLTAAEVDEIRRISSYGIANLDLGRLFDVHHATVSAIKLGKTWHK